MSAVDLSEPTSGSQGSIDPGSGRFRPDLEGLRAVAVLLVLLFHAGIPGVPGGFVGVDVFFVLSGFLITGLIVRELTATGNVDLPAFYARRARRLLPAAAVVLLVTIIVAAVVLPPLAVTDVAADVAAAALYVSNLRFALTATDYFQAAVAPSPVLHYWSLGVEEQFYLFWPALLLLATKVRLGSLRGLAVAVATISGLSLVASVVGTGISEPWAFYSLPTRAWQLGLGGLLALLDLSGFGLGIAAATVAAALGLVIVVASGLAVDTTVAYPGVAALAPSAGAALVILAGLGGTGALPAPSRLLALAPMRYIGRISYSLYLWHWPVLVLAAAALSTPLPLLARLALMVLAVVLAAVTQRWVEDPIRRGRLVGRVSSRNLSMAGALGLTVAIVSLAIGIAVRPPAGSTASVDPAQQVGQALGSPGAMAGPSTASASAGAPGASSSPQPVPTTPAGPVPANLDPPLSSAHEDLPRIYRDGCELGQAATSSPTCSYGDSAAQTTVVLFGDSHAAQWFPALEALATERHWRLIVLTKTLCAAVAHTMWDGLQRRPYGECDAWRADSLRRIANLRPVLVVVSNSKSATFALGDRAASQSETAAGWQTALSVVLQQLAADATRVVLVGDTPSMATDPATCLSAHLDDALACARPRQEAVDGPRMAADQAAAAAAGVGFVDPTPWVCPTEPCPVIVGSVLLYADAGHIDATFSGALAPYVGAAVGVP